jgi:phosphate transport system permease protein
MNEIAMSSKLSASSAEVTRLLGNDRRHLIRKVKDRLAAVTISAGGMSVLFAILLIFFYLLFEIIPLFRSASIEPVADFPVAKLGDVGKPLYLAVCASTRPAK